MIFFPKLLRGCSWDDFSWDCRSAYRNHFPPYFAFGNVGFRIVYLPAKQ
jgi:formylglycine-generating enzyme required for sulfatase activity